MEGQLNLFGGVEVGHKETELEKFRAECEVFIVEDGTGFLHGKDRVFDAYNDGTLDETFLKNEYGVGCHSVKWKDGSRGFTNHNPGGIECIKYKDEKNLTVIFNWRDVLKLIKKAIYEGRYTTRRIKWE